MRKLLLVFLLLFNTRVQAQTVCDSLTAEGFIKGAVRSLQDGRKDSLKYYSDKITGCRDLHAWMRLHRLLGAAYRNQKNYEAALVEFRRAIEESWRRPENEKEFRELAIIYASIGYTHKKLNDQQAIVECYEKAVAIFVDTIKVEDVYVAKSIFSELGNAYNRLRDYDKAIFYHQRRLDILQKAQQWDEVAGAFNDLGMVYLKQRDLDQAIKAFSDGLDTKDVGFDNKVLLLFNLGYIYLVKGDLEKALDYTTQCERIVLNADISPQEKAAKLIWVYDNFAKYYKIKKDFKTSERYYFLRIKAAKTADPTDRRSLALSFVSRGNLYLEWSKPDKALKDFSTALQYLLTDFVADTPYALPSEAQLVAEPTLVDALGSMAQCFAALNRRTPSDELAAKATECFDLTDKVEALLLKDYILEGSQLKALREHRWTKSAEMSFVYDRWSLKQNAELQESLFSISEQSRALLLWEDMERTKAQQLNPHRAEYRSVKEDIENLEQQLYRFPVSQFKHLNDSIGMALLKAKERKAALLAQTEDTHLNLAPGTRKDLARIAAVKQQLKADEALVEYFIQDRDAYIFVIDGQQGLLTVKKIGWNSEWSEAATTLKEDIFNQNDAAYILKARKLYEHLLKPVLDITHAGHLIIIPDGDLWNVPFDALLVGDVDKKDQRNFKNFPYVLNKKSISYGISATLQLEMCRKAGNPPGKKLLVFAPGYRQIRWLNSQNTDNRNRLDTLLYNIECAEAIAGIGNGRCFPEDLATRKGFLQSISMASILHIQAHAKANHQNPDLSFIAFSNTRDTLSEPYRLYAYELANHLDSLSTTRPGGLDMVVLGACESGTGRLWDGEGMLSLARVFVAKGTRSIVSTLWNIDDEASKNIMVTFYQNLKNHMTKDQALWDAKRSYISQAPDQARAHPRYWASFTPLGNMEPLQMPERYWPNLPIGLLVFGIILGVGFLGWSILKRRGFIH